MRMTSLAAFGLAVSLAAAPAAAQELDDARLDAASTLVESLNIQQMMAQLAPATTRNIVSALAQNGEVNQETRDTVSRVVRREMAEKLPDLIPLLAPVTAEAFTQEELDALNEFYGSEIGREIVRKLPGYQGQASRLVGNWMQQEMSEVETDILAALEEEGIEVQRPGEAEGQTTPEDAPQTGQ